MKQEPTPLESFIKDHYKEVEQYFPIKPSIKIYVSKKNGEETDLNKIKLEFIDFEVNKNKENNL